ncbi:MAG TPA: adenylate/guanylate cyclase domain-containing protein [Acidimicrobiia bacterium]
MERKRVVLGITSETVDKLKQAITNKISTSLTEQLKDQPQAFERLVELGLVESDLLENPDELDLIGTIRQFKERISELAATEPSVLAHLDVRPLDVMRSDETQLSLPPKAPLVQVPLTIVFSDLEGFTSFTSERGDIEASALLTDHYDTVSAITKSRGGRVIKKIGDGHMLAFPEPAAAVMASLDLTEAAPKPLRLRAGAHRGPVVQTSDDLLGHVVNVASRVTDLASGGESLITRQVREEAGALPHVAFVQTRTEHLAGVDEEIEVSEAIVA